VEIYNTYCTLWGFDKMIVQSADIKEIIEEIKKAEYIALDTETVSLMDKTLVAFTFAFNNKTYFCPIKMDYFFNLPMEKAKVLLQEICNHKGVIFHHFAFDGLVLSNIGITFNHAPHDTLLISHLINENISHSLKKLTKHYLKYDMLKYKDVCGVGRKQIHFSEVQDKELAIQYAEDDVKYTLQLFNLLYPKLNNNMKKAYDNIERPLLLVVLDMHLTGVPVNSSKIDLVKSTCVSQRDFYKAKLEHYMSDVNLNSSKQLREYFINYKGCRVLRRSRITGEPSVNSDVLKKYAKSGINEAEWILRYRYYSKILATFIPALTPDENGLIHPWFHQVGTTSGRFSSSNPSCQNLPNAKDDNLHIRSCIEAGDGYKLVGFDYSAIELRLTAHFSNEEKLIEVFNKNLDIHQQVADDVGCSRNQAKTLSYACVPLTAKALTRTGWKGYNDLIEGEDILAFNPKTKLNEWTPCLKKVYYESAPVIKWKDGLGFEVESTPNHRWCGKKRIQCGHAETSFRYYDDVIFTTEKANTECAIRRTAHAKSDSELNLNKILDKSVDDNKWVEYVLKMSESERYLWFSANIATDGYKDRKYDIYLFSQNYEHQPGLFNAMVLCGYLLGYNVHEIKKGVGMKIVRFGKRQTTPMQNMQITSEGNKPVWCVQTKFGTWVMKQGRTITITGNTLYGAGINVISKNMKSSREEACQYLANFRVKYPSLAKFISSTRQKCIEDEKVVMLYNRERHLPEDFESFKDWDKGGIIRSMVNALIQGSSAMMMKKAMIDIHEELKNLNAHLILTVHDELICIVEESEAEKVAKIMKECMERAGIGLKVPITVEGGIGDNWEEVH